MSPGNGRSDVARRHLVSDLECGKNLNLGLGVSPMDAKSCTSELLMIDVLDERHWNVNHFVPASSSRLANYVFEQRNGHPGFKLRREESKSSSGKLLAQEWDRNSVITRNLKARFHIGPTYCGNDAI